MIEVDAEGNTDDASSSISSEADLTLSEEIVFDIMPPPTGSRSISHIFSSDSEIKLAVADVGENPDLASFKAVAATKQLTNTRLDGTPATGSSDAQLAANAESEKQLIASAEKLKLTDKPTV